MIISIIEINSEMKSWNFNDTIALKIELLDTEWPVESHSIQGLCCSLTELSRAAYEVNDLHRWGPQSQAAWMRQLIAVYTGRICT